MTVNGRGYTGQVGACSRLGAQRVCARQFGVLKAVRWAFSEALAGLFSAWAC